jgi:hypothetical protein
VGAIFGRPHISFLKSQHHNPMLNLILFPFRVIAFIFRMILWMIAIPLIIVIRILEVIAPEIMRPLRNAITTVIGIFKF